MSPPVFLLAFANDREDAAHYLRNLPKELRQITDALDQAKSAGLCDYISIPNATLKQLLDTFQKAEYRNRIAGFHYGGHANSLQLMLESSDGRTAIADARGLAAFLSHQLGLKLVFLNGCSTQPQVEALLDANIPMVIATSQAIDDAVAMDFASRFYRGLASGTNIQSAYEEAAAAVRTASSGTVRHLYWTGAPSTLIEEARWPWELRFKKGAETEGQWSLPEAVGNPLFGLPDIIPRDLPDEPFRHLTWFTREHAEIFFGRNYEVRQLYDRITEPNAAPIVLLYGQAGVGKSSLLDAGLIPRLETGYEILYLRRNQDLGLKETAVQGMKYVNHKNTTLGSAWLGRETPQAKPLVLILDQIEEVFTRPNRNLDDELEDFLKALDDTFALPQSRPGGKLILGFRKEWESEIEQRLKEHKLPHAKVFLEPLNRQAIIQAITGVANSPRLQRHYGLNIESDLAEVIADDLASDPDSPVAPTLQILLTKMWTEARKLNNARPTFDHELYSRLREAGILLGDFLDQQLSKLKEDHPEVVNSGLALDLLAFHTTDLGTAAQRTDSEIRTEYSHQTTVLSLLIDKLKELYLIADPPQDQVDQASVKATRLAHDTIAPLVRARFDKSVLPGQRARRVLENRSPDWQGNSEGVPLDARDLATVENGAAGMRNWTSDEKRLVEASRKLRDRRKRTGRTLRIAGVTGVVVILVAALYAWWQRGKAIDAERKAVARQLTTQANSLAAGPADLLMLRVLLAIEANSREVYGEGVDALYSGLALLPFRRARFQHEGAVTSVQFSPDGKLLATGSKDKTARIWNRTNGTEVARVTHRYPVTSVVFSNDGRYFISGSGEGEYGKQSYGEVKAWDSQNKTELIIAEDLGAPVRDMVFLSENYSLVIQTLYDVRTISLVNRQPQNPLQIGTSRDAVLSPDGRFVAFQQNLIINIADVTKKSPTVSFSITPNLGNEYSREQMEAMPQERRDLVRKGIEENKAEMMAFSHDGRYLAIATFERLVYVWDWLHREQVFQRKELELGRPVGPPSALSFSPDDKYIGYIGRNQYVNIWDVVTGQEIWGYKIDDQNSFAGLRFLDSSRLLLVGNRSVRMFRLPSAGDASQRLGVEELRVCPEVPVLEVGLTPDGQQLAVAEESGWASVWDLKTIQQDKIVENAWGTWYSPSGLYRLSYELGAGMKILESATDKLVGACRLSQMQAVTGLTDEFVAVSGPDGNVKVCQLSTANVVREFNTGSEPRDLVFSRTRRVLFAVTRDDAHPKELNLDDGSVKELSNVNANREARFSRDGKYLVTTKNQSGSSADNIRSSLEIFDVGTSQTITNISADGESYEFPTFSPDGEHVAARSRGVGATEVVVWKSRTGRQVKRLPSASFFGYGFSDDGNNFVIASGTNVLILDLQTLEIKPIQTLTQVQRQILSLDSKHLLTLSEDLKLQVWNVADGSRMFSTQLDTVAPYNLQFSPDGKYLIIAGDFKSVNADSSTQVHPQVRFITWQAKDLLKEACRRVTRPLSDNEWRQYFGNVDKKDTCSDIN